MQGLRVLITGGEPLMHPEFEKINDFIKELPIRKILFTNGVLLNDNILKKTECRRNSDKSRWNEKKDMKS